MQAIICSPTIPTSSPSLELCEGTLGGVAARRPTGSGVSDPVGRDSGLNATGGAAVSYIEVAE